MSAELDHVWSQIKAELAQTVDDPVYRIWLEPLRAIDLADGHLTLAASPQSCAWVRDRFGRILQACSAAVLGPDLTVDVIEVKHENDHRLQGSPGPPSIAKHGSRSGGRAHKDPSSPSPANPKLTFEQFVIGDSNRLAHAAALAVSEMPAQAYNPLFICGPPGLGKTHLLSSIANLIRAYSPDLQVRRTTGEAFTNEFMVALGSGGLERFKAGFRHVDVLLIDDVQFLERKTKTEEEFFHTFDALYEAGSQIVLTSDRPPNDLQALEDRLRERFAAGLVADIRPPDLPTRLAILRKRADYDRLEIQDPSALEAIAERVSVNVRALEGALIRVVAFSSLTGRPLTAGLAREVLDGLYTDREQRGRSIEDIKAAACAQFGLSSQELVSPSRTPRIAWPRQVAMYLARELTEESLPTIGRAFGGRDHTTVLHAWRRTEERIASSVESKAAVDELRRRLSTAS